MYKKLTEEYEETLFSNYALTDLMIMEKNGRQVKANQNSALGILLRQKLEEYGILLSLNVRSGNMIFRAIFLAEDFPLENEPIISQLYGYTGMKINIQLRSFDSYGVAFDYDLDSKTCDLQRHAWGKKTHSVPYNCLADMLADIKARSYSEIFNLD